MDLDHKLLLFSEKDHTLLLFSEIYLDHKLVLFKEVDLDHMLLLLPEVELYLMCLLFSEVDLDHILLLLQEVDLNHMRLMIPKVDLDHSSNVLRGGFRPPSSTLLMAGYGQRYFSSHIWVRHRNAFSVTVLLAVCLKEGGHHDSDILGIFTNYLEHNVMMRALSDKVLLTHCLAYFLEKHLLMQSFLCSKMVYFKPGDFLV